MRSLSRTKKRVSHLLLLPLQLRWPVEPMYVFVTDNDHDADDIQYAYSAWAPQFADKLQLSATQSNIIVRGS